MRNRILPCAAMLLLGASVTLQAELSRQDRKAANGLLSGTLYLRIDAPCGTGRHPMGTYMFPLVEVSPNGVNTEGETGFSGGAFHAQSTYWGVGPNDTLQLDEMDWDEDTVEIELEGVGKTDGNDTVLKFVNINTLDISGKPSIWLSRRCRSRMSTRTGRRTSGRPSATANSSRG